MSKLSAEALSVKKELEEIKAKKRLLKSLERQMEEARYSIGITGIDYGRISTKGGVKTSAQERFTLLMDKLERRYYEIAEEVYAAESVLLSELNSLTAVEQAILTDRFINGKGWIEIQKIHHYCERQTRRIAEKAMEKLGKTKNVR